MSAESIPSMLAPDEYPRHERYSPESGEAEERGGFMRVEQREFTLLHRLYVAFWNYAGRGARLEDACLARTLRALNAFYEGRQDAGPLPPGAAGKERCRPRGAGRGKNSGGADGH